MMRPAEAQTTRLSNGRTHLLQMKNRCWPVLMPVTLSLQLSFAKVGYQEVQREVVFSMMQLCILYFTT